MEDRLAVLEGGSGDSVKLPDPILTCVQCEAEYKDSENAGRRYSIPRVRMPWYKLIIVGAVCYIHAGRGEGAR